VTGSPHTTAVRLLGPAALGLLTSVEQAELDAHLAECAECRTELAQLTRVTDRMSALSPEEAVSGLLAPTAAIADGVMAAIVHDRAGERRRAQRMQSVLSAAAAVVVLVAGIATAGALRTEDAPKVPLEAVAVQASAGIDAKANLVAHTWGVEIKLAASGLGAGQAYKVRVRTTAGAVVDAGAFIGTGARTLNCNLNASVLREDAKAFTVVDSSGRTVATATL
jgi:anti-sigma factor RsiW